MADLGPEMPFSCLSFSGREREADFCRGYTASHLRMVDRLYHRFGCLATLAYAWQRLKSDGPAWDAASAVLVVLAGAAFDWLWSALDVDKRQDFRQTAAIVVRVCMGSLPAALLAPIWFVTSKGAPFTTFRYMVLNTGALTLAYVTFAIPLLARHHLAVQVPTVCFMILYLPRTACAEGALTPADAPHLEAAWRWLWMLSAIGSGYPPALPVDRIPTPPVARCCRDIVVFSDLVLGLALPSYVLWVAEAGARMRFAPGLAPKLTWGVVGAQGLLLAAVAACLWALLSGWA